MRFLKLIGISIIILFMLITVLGLLFPSEVIVSRAVDITAPKDSIRMLLKDFNGWKQWVDGMNDPSVKINSPTKALLGKTQVTITNITDSSIVSTWVAQNGNVQHATIYFFTEGTNAQTVVHWQFSQQLKWYPWERFASMMNDKILGTMMEKNLSNLKTLVQNNTH